MNAILLVIALLLPVREHSVGEGRYGARIMAEVRAAKERQELAKALGCPSGQ